jgi:hypothetical protein
MERFPSASPAIFICYNPRMMSNSPYEVILKRSASIFLWLGTALFSIGLLLYAYLGIYNRFWADDWCYNADLNTLGFWGTMQGYTFITHYASNRISLTFFTLLMQQWDIFSAQITATLVIILWFGGLFLILQGLNRFFNFKLKMAFIILVTVVIEYYSFYLAPNQFRTLYFRSSVLTYSAPLICSLYVFGLLLWQANRERPSRTLAFWMAPLSFIAATFSEAGCAYLGAALGILWLVTFIYKRKGHLWAKCIFPAATIALASVALATLVLVLSPAIAPRHVGYPDPMNPLKVPVLAVVFTFDFIQSSLRGLVVPHAVFGLLFLLLPFFAAVAGTETNISLSKSVKAILVIAVLAVLLIAASQVPAIYIEGGPPASKALISARFTLLFAFAAIFWLVGHWLVARIKGNYRYAALLLILVPILYTIRPIALDYAELPRYVQRAKVWDERDQSILAAKEQGILQIDVKGIDSRYIGQTLDFKENPNFWVNGCAETVYGVDEIRATLP